MSEPIHRRRFLEQSLAAAIAVEIAASSSLAATTVESLLSHADPRLIPKAPPPPAARNAFPLLERIARQLTPEPNTWHDTVEGAWEELPEKEVIRLHHAWLTENPTALKQLEEALLLEACEYPRDAYSESSFDLLGPFRSLARLMAAQARAAVADDDPVEAARIVQLAANGFRALRLGGGMFVEYLVASACEFSLWPMLLEIAAHPKYEATQLRGLLSKLPIDSESNAGLRRTLQAEYCRCMLPELAKLSECDREELFPTILPWSDNGVTAREHHDLHIRLLRALLAEHPRPFDATETASLGGERFARILGDLELSWAIHKAQPEPGFAELEPWPSQLALSSLYVGNLEEIGEEQISAAREKLSKVVNPVGKKLVETMTIESKQVHQIAMREQTRYDGQRITLALIVYDKEHGRLPDSLEQLESKKLLEFLPTDPFTGKTYGYSRKDRAAWSVGSAGTVSPGVDPEEEFEVETLLWRLPSLDGVAN